MSGPLAWATALALLLAALPLAAPTWAQTESRPGIGVDARGQSVVDPTRNVLDLVKAAVQRLNDLARAEAKLQETIRTLEAQRLSELRTADIMRIDELRAAETRRVDQLAQSKQIFDLELARVIRANVDASTSLLATQLKEFEDRLFGADRETGTVCQRAARARQRRQRGMGRDGPAGDDAYRRDRAYRDPDQVKRKGAAMNVSGEAAAALNAIRLDDMTTVNKGILVSADDQTGAVTWKDKLGTDQTVTLGPHSIRLISARR